MLVVIMKNLTRQIFVIFCCIFSLSSCFKPYDNLNRQVLADEQLEMENNATEMKMWQTNDLSILYNAVDSGNAVTLTGFVEISDSVTYTFPQADFLIIYVYLLNQDGISTSRHSIRPGISRFNTIGQESRFSKIIPKDADTASFTFGYWGNFVYTEREVEDGRSRSSGGQWEIYHSPFE